MGFQNFYEARHGGVRQGLAGYGLDFQNFYLVWHGAAWSGMVRRGAVRIYKIFMRRGEAWFGKAGRGGVWRGLSDSLCGRLRLGMAGLGLAR